MKDIDREKRIGITAILIWFLGSTLFLGFQTFQKINAVGGGWINTPASGSSSTNGTSSAITLSTAIGTGTLSEIKGNYFVVEASTFSKKISVLKINDTQSDAYHLSVKSSVHLDTEIWYANFTGTNFGSNTITTTFNATTKFLINIWLLTGVSTGSLQTVKSNGTSSPVFVHTFTPNSNDACINWVSITPNQGILSESYGNPNFWYFTTPTTFSGLSPSFLTHSLGENNWANYGSTNVSMTLSAFTTGGGWDSVVSCFPEGPSTITTTSDSTTTTTTTTTSNSTTTTTTTTTTTSSTTTTITSSQILAQDDTSSVFLLFLVPLAAIGILILRKRQRGT